MRSRILVIDDEEALCEIIKFNLEKEGYEVDMALSAEEALTKDLTRYDLFIVDIMMDKLSGFDFARIAKENQDVEETPIIFCSALVGEDDKVFGLNLGADDYITKPFTVSEVLARVRAVLRRSSMMSMSRRGSGESTPAVVPAKVEEEKKETMHPNFEPDLVYKTLRLNQNTKECTIDDNHVDLTKTEYDLLRFFLLHRGRVYSRSEIKKDVWSTTVVSDRTIDANITRLRRKMGIYGGCIETRTGFGYSFKENLG